MRHISSPAFSVAPLACGSLPIYTHRTLCIILPQLTGAHADASFEHVVDLTSRDQLGPMNAVDVGHREANKVEVGSGTVHPVSVLLVRCLRRR